MEQARLTSLLGKELLDAELIYQGCHSEKELRLLADIFAEALEGENPDSIHAAFALHVKRNTRFPTPAHIVALLPECRVTPKRAAIPEETSSPRTEGLGIIVRLALRGDEKARAFMDKRAFLSQEEAERIIRGMCYANNS